MQTMTTALRSIGILPKPTDKNPGTPVRMADVARPVGTGMFMRWDLPGDSGKEAVDVVKLAGRLAAFYGSPRSRFVVDLGEHDGQFTTWSSRVDPFAGPLRPHPCLGMTSFDAWGPAPWGHDQMGRIVYTAYPYTSRLIAARPRVGKSFLAMAQLVPAVLDPTMRFVCINLKGGGTWKALEPLCETYISGQWDEDVEKAAAALEELVAEMRRRNDLLQDGSKLTKRHAAALGISLLQLVFDEGQEGTTHPVHGKRIVKALTTLAKVGPSCGISPTFITQRPDEDSLPPGLRAAFGEVSCLQVKTIHDSNIALGNMSKYGYDASRIRQRAVSIHVPDSNNDGIPDDELTANLWARTVRSCDMGDDGEVFAAFCHVGTELRANYQPADPADAVVAESTPGGLLASTVTALRTYGDLSATGLLARLPEPWSLLTATELGKELGAADLSSRETHSGRRYTVADAVAAASRHRDDPAAPTVPATVARLARHALATPDGTQPPHTTTPQGDAP